MIRKFTLAFYLALHTAFVIAQCPVTTLTSANIVANTTWAAGTYNIAGDFTLGAGATLTITYNNNCPLTINATTINVLGYINANGIGGAGGSGGGAGSSSGGPGGASQGGGGGGGTQGMGAGGGVAGPAGGSSSGGCAINCGNFICSGGNDAVTAGGGGGAGGAGGSHGGSGGRGGSGATGRLESLPGNTNCGNSPGGGGGGAGPLAASAYDVAQNASDVLTGSGGGGAGGGGGGYNEGSAGFEGGRGGGGVNLNATGKLVMAGTITANGTNGAVGGNGGVRSGGSDYNCDACGNGSGGGNNTCRDASLCGACTYYTWSWPGGGGGGAGGGSGGAVKLQGGGGLSVTGNIQANGGSGGNAGRPWQNLDGVCNNLAQAGAGGGGGVIKFVYNPCAVNNFFTGQLQVSGGAAGTNSDGNAGTNNGSSGLVLDQSFNIYVPGYTQMFVVAAGADQNLCGPGQPAAINASAVAGGASGPFNYQWYSTTSTGNAQTGTGALPGTGWTAVNNAVSQSLSSATMGTVSTTTRYQVRVQTGGCYVWSNVVTVSVSDAITINNVSVTNALCNGANGSIAIDASSGNSTLSYSVNGGSTYQAGNTFNVAAGNYNIVVKDANNCSVSYGSNPVQLTQPADVSQTANVVDSRCVQFNDGAIYITPAGGTAPYRFSIDGSLPQFEDSFTLLSAATYQLVTMDNNGCKDTVSAVVNNRSAITASVFSQSNVSCFLDTNGTVTLQATGGVSPYGYRIAYLDTNFQTSSTFNGLIAEPYTAIVIDALGCTAATSFTITQPDALSLQIDSVDNVKCGGTASGTVFTEATGGTTPYSFAWSNGTTNQNATNVPAGIHTVTVTDNNGCQQMDVALVTELDSLLLNLSIYPPSCQGFGDGAIATHVAGGTAPYVYQWSTASVNDSISNLTAGNYSVTVNDASNCSAVENITLTAPATVTSTVTATNNLCFGASDGSAIVTPTGGTPPFNYNWSNGQAIATATNLAQGTYSVTVADSRGCQTVDSAVIEQPQNPVAVTIAATQPACNGDLGSAVASSTGGSPQYAYLWSNTVVDDTVTGLLAGNYSVTVHDSNNCSASATAGIVEPAALSSMVTTTNIDCFGEQTGTAKLAIAGGTTPYTYLWSNGATTDSVSALAAATYGATVTDANGCPLAVSLTISQAAAIQLTLAANNVNCAGAQNGSIAATATGGNLPHTYAWSNSTTNDTAMGLAPGTYSLTLTDAGGCSITATASVTEPAQLSAPTTVTDAANNQNNGTATTTPAGGTAPYTQLWSNGQTTATATGLAPGNYTVTVTDALGCTITATATVSFGTGIGKLRADFAFSIYPNPAITDVTVQVQNWVQPIGLTIKDVVGHNVFTGTLTQQLSKIDVSQLANGLYLVELRQGDKISVKQVVVSK